MEHTDASPRARQAALDARLDRIETAVAEMAAVMSRLGPSNFTSFCPTLGQVMADARRRDAQATTGGEAA